ncbi:hypothetical protein PMAC_003165 [Pneumocystis sp. 'macacae']|nr:hypothetical protein PMAC_003165 [Pneumocystis sp. 'macacae']
MREDKENIIIRGIPQTPAHGIEFSAKTGCVDGLESRGPGGCQTGSLITPLRQRQILGGKDTNIRNAPVSVLNVKSSLLNPKLPSLDNCLYTIPSGLHAGSTKKKGCKSPSKFFHETFPICVAPRLNGLTVTENTGKIADPEYMPPRSKALAHDVPGFSPVDWSVLQAWPFYCSYFNRLDDQGQSELERYNESIIGNPVWEPVEVSTLSKSSSTKTQSSMTKSFDYQKPTESFRRKCSTTSSLNRAKKGSIRDCPKRITSSLDDFGLTFNEINLTDEHLFQDEPFPFEL